MSEPAVGRARPAIPLSVPTVSGRELDYVKAALDAGWVSSAGPDVREFEQEVAAFVGAAHAVATSSGTAAIHIGLLLAGVQPEEEVIVPTLTFIAPANAVRYAGAWPVFVDVDEDYWQLDPVALRRFVTEDCEQRGGRLHNRHTGRRVTAVLPVHLLGHPCDLDPIAEIAAEHGLAVVQDAAESLGAEYRGTPVGGTGPIACLSFNGNKIMTAGGGGMVAVDSGDDAERARALTTHARVDRHEYVHDEVAYNYRLSNLQAAFGRGQLTLLPEFVATKRRIAATYAEAFAGVAGVGPMPEAPWASATFWLYTILVDPDVAGLTARDLMRRLAEHEIETRPLWQPMHLSKAHATSYAAPCPNGERVAALGLSLPSSTGLTDDDQEHVIARVLAAIAEGG